MRLPDDGRIVTGAASSDECESAECVPRQLRVLCLRVQRELRPLERRAAKPPGGLRQPAAGAWSLYLRLAVSEFPRARNRTRRTVEVAVGATAIVCFVLSASILVVGSSGRPTSGASAAASTARPPSPRVLRGVRGSTTGRGGPDVRDPERHRARVGDVRRDAIPGAVAVLGGGGPRQPRGEEEQQGDATAPWRVAGGRRWVDRQAELRVVLS
jgi:hypothetical protein